MCRLCGLWVDFRLHSFRLCNRVRAIWNRSVATAYRQVFFTALTTISWVDKNLNSELGTTDDLVEWTFLFHEAVHAIWFWRNALLFRESDGIPSYHGGIGS